MSHTVAGKKQLIARVRRIGGQVAALERSLEADAGCEAVLHQVAAVRGAIQGLMNKVLEDHLRQHVAVGGPRGQAELQPIIDVLKSYLK
jgi:DNA-binding FrmR family transcriptional regulator